MWVRWPVSGERESLVRMRLAVEHRTLVDAIGRTPLVRVGRAVPATSAEVLLKLEKRNPGGSLRDRVVRFALEEALHEDRLAPKGAVVAASGEDGAFSASMICAVRGHPLELFMPLGYTRPERRKIVTRFGTVVREVPGTLDDARAAAAAAAKEKKACLIDIESAQIATRACAEIGHELLEALGDDAPATPGLEGGSPAPRSGIDAFVAVVRSGGTVEGVGGVLHARYPDMAVHAVRLDGFTRAEAHGMVDVSRAEADAAASDLARLEGLLVGPASGAAFVVGRRVAESLGKGKRVVVLCSDPGERHLKT